MKMRTYTQEEIEQMDLETAQAELSNNLYEASRLIEQLEYTKNKEGNKRISGNGHHIRQQIAKFGTDLLAERLDT
jgi:hypothetical protein